MFSAILFGIGLVFAFHAWLGLRTQTVRFPMSIFTFQEFDRGESPANFWGILILNLIGAVLCLGVSAAMVVSSIAPFRRPIGSISALNGCYEGEGSPDFMRPRIHWIFRLNEGVVVDRIGNRVSEVKLNGNTGNLTYLTFSPGILVSVDKHKSSTVYRGDIITGKAYSSGATRNIILDNDWGEVLNSTSCR